MQHQNAYARLAFHIPEFDYKATDVLTWLQSIEELGHLEGWTDETRLSVASIRLGPIAKQWYNSWRHAVGAGALTWDRLREALRDRYGVSDRELHLRLANCKQERRESVRDYADRYLSLMTQLRLAVDQDPTHMHNFLKGLRGSVYKMVYLMKPRNLTYAIRDAIYISEGGDRISERDDEDDREETRVRFDTRASYSPGRQQSNDRGYGRYTHTSERANPSPGPRSNAPPRYNSQRRPAPPGSARPSDIANVQDQMARLNLSGDRARPRAAANLCHVHWEDEDPYSYTEDEGATSDDDCEEPSPQHPDLVHANSYEVNMKRIGDFDPVTLPRKRVPVTMRGNDPMELDRHRPEPRRFSAGRAPQLPRPRPAGPGPAPPPPPPAAGPAVRAAAAVPLTAAAPATSQASPRPAGRPSTTGAPRAYVRPVPAAAPAGLTPVAAPRAPVAAPAAGNTAAEAGRVNVVGRLAPRADQVPGDPAVEERRIADDIVSKINRYSLTLGTALKCNAASIYTKVGGKMLGIARQHARAAGEPVAHAHQSSTPSNEPGLVEARWQVCKADVGVRDGNGVVQPLRAVLDSGASHTIVPFKTLTHLGLTSIIEATEVEVINADDYAAPACGRARGLTLSLGDREVRVNGVVNLAEAYDILLGNDFMGRINADLKYSTSQLEYTNDAGTRSVLPIVFVRSQPTPAAKATPAGRPSKAYMVDIQSSPQPSQDLDPEEPPTTANSPASKDTQSSPQPSQGEDSEEPSTTTDSPAPPPPPTSEAVQVVPESQGDPLYLPLLTTVYEVSSGDNEEPEATPPETSTEEQLRQAFARSPLPSLSSPQVTALTLCVSNTAAGEEEGEIGNDYSPDPMSPMGAPGEPKWSFEVEPPWSPTAEGVDTPTTLSNVNSEGGAQGGSCEPRDMSWSAPTPAHVAPDPVSRDPVSLVVECMLMGKGQPAEQTPCVSPVLPPPLQLPPLFYPPYEPPAPHKVGWKATRPSPSPFLTIQHRRPKPGFGYNTIAAEVDEPMCSPKAKRGRYSCRGEGLPGPGNDDSSGAGGPRHPGEAPSEAGVGSQDERLCALLAASASAHSTPRIWELDLNPADEPPALLDDDGGWDLRGSQGEQSGSQGGYSSVDLGEEAADLWGNDSAGDDWGRKAPGLAAGYCLYGLYDSYELYEHYPGKRDEAGVDEEAPAPTSATVGPTFSLDGPPSKDHVLSLTPAQHLQLAREYGAWYREQRGAAPAEDERAAQLGTKVAPDMPADVQERIRQVLRDNYDMFATSNAELGCTNWVRATINTGDAAPVCQNPYRASKAEREAMEAEVSRMLADGVIRHSTSAWSSPVVMVAKGVRGPSPTAMQFGFSPEDPTATPGTMAQPSKPELRFCIDLRAVNDLTVPERWPMPVAGTLIDTLAPPLGSQRVYSALDIKAAFWQVEVEEADRCKLAFQAPSGLYEFNVLPMGARSSPAVFQRLMSLVLRPVLARGAALGNPAKGKEPERGSDDPNPSTDLQRCAVLFIDDVCVFSPSPEDHVQHLSDVLDLVRLANLRFALKKCEFGKPQVQFLGHEISGLDGTIKPAAKNLNIVAAYPRLRTVRQVKAFLGLTGYYRRFVPNYSLIAGPLFECLTKDGFVWGPRQQEAFEKLKDALTREPILQSPDFDREFILATDFCRTSVAACLSQVFADGLERPVAFASKRLSGSQCNWGSTDGEAYAAVWGIKHFHEYLWGTHFTLYTDNSALTFIMRAKDLTGKLARYALRLASYDFSIVHRAGRKMGHVDGLSRLGHLINDDQEEDEGAAPALVPEREDAVAVEALTCLPRQPLRVWAYMADAMDEGDPMVDDSFASPAPAPTGGAGMVRETPLGAALLSSPGLPALSIRDSLRSPSGNRVRRPRHRQPNRNLLGFAGNERSDDDIVCAACGQPRPAFNMLLCDHAGCSQAYHTTCLRPPLRTVPEGNWYCPEHAASGSAPPPPPVGPPAGVAPGVQMPPWGSLPVLPAPLIAPPAGAEAVVNTAAGGDHGGAAGTSGPSIAAAVPAPTHLGAAPGPAGTVTAGAPGARAPVEDSSDVTEPPEEEGSDGDEGDDEGEDCEEEGEEEEGHESASDSVLEVDGVPQYGTEETPVWKDKALLIYLRTGDFLAPDKDDWAGYYRECQRVQRKARRYYFKDGQLWRRSKAPKPEVRVLTLSERMEALRQAHDGSHPGVSGTFDILKNRVTWAGMMKDVRVYVAGCEQCMVKNHTLIRNLPIRPLPITGLWTRIHVDLTRMPRSARGGRYLIAAVDAFSKWPEAGVLPSKEASETARWFHSEIFSRVGAVRQCVSDLGTEWDAEFAELLKQNRCVHRRCSPRTPTTNGLCERFISYMRQALVRLCQESGREEDWDLYVPQVLFAYRCKPQHSTRISPALCLYGRELLCPMQLPEPEPRAVEQEEDVSDMEMDYTWLKERQQQLTVLQETVVTNLTQAHEKQVVDHRRRTFVSPTPQPRGRKANTGPAVARTAEEAGVPVPGASTGAARPRPNNSSDGGAGEAERGIPRPRMQAALELAAPQSPPGRQGSVRRPKQGKEGVASGSPRSPPGRPRAAAGNTAGALPAKPQRQGKGRGQVPGAGTTGPAGAGAPGPASGAQPQRSCDEVADDDPRYAHLPALSHGELVYRLVKPSTKMQPREEGPYRFVAYSRGGHLAKLEDGVGTQFTVSVRQLLVRKEHA